MRIVEVIHFLDPDQQATINSMVARAGLNGDASVDQLLTACPYTNPDMPRDERLALVSLVYKRPNRFAQKLNFANRCEILALHRMGIPRETLAVMYQIDRRTVAHIYTPNGPHYKNVRAEEVGLGTQKFREVYVTQDLLNKALAYNAANKAKDKAPVNNKHATHKAGIHNVRGPMCTYDHRVAIQWREPDGDIETAGWYYMDLDGDYPNTWFCVGDESLKTSQACYNAMIEDIADKVSTS